MNYAVLKQELIADPALTVISINAKNTPSKQDIQTADIKKYLIVTGKYLAIIDSVDPAARMTVVALDTFENFIMSDPVNESALIAQMDGLVTAGLITAADKTFILAMGDTLISRAEQLGLGVVTLGDIQALGAL